MRPSARPLPRPLDCRLQRLHVSRALPSRSSSCGSRSISSRQAQCSRLSCRAAAAPEHSSTSSTVSAGQGTAPGARHDQAGTQRLQQALDCRHFEQCSGCTVAEAAAIPEPPIAARAREYFRGLGHTEFSVTLGAVHGWRCRARLAVRGRPGRPVIGLYRAGTHDALDIPDCRVQHPRINEAAEAVRAAAAELRVPPYAESTGAGALRYLQLTAVGTDPQRPAAQHDPRALVQVVLVWNATAARAEQDAELRALADALWRRHGPGSPAPLLHSVWANAQPARGNTIFGGDWLPLRRLLDAGDPFTWQVLGGAAVASAPGSFMQANFGAMDAALAAIARHVPPDSAVADLHCGVGTIGLALAASGRCRSVRFVEINPQCEAPFRAAARQLTSTAQLTYHVAAAGSAPHAFIADTDVVIVDPPRKGLEPGLLAALTALPAPDRLPLGGSASRRGEAPVVPKDALESQKTDTATGTGVERASQPHMLIYLSCGFPALERDCAALLGSGRWRLQRGEAFLFFPGTDSIETLAVFRRQ